MSRTTHVILPLLGLLALGSSALASNLTIKSRLSETFDFNDNNNNSGSSNGSSSGTIGSYSTISGSLLHRTPTSSFTTDGSFSYRKTFNLGSEPENEGTKNHSVGMSYSTFNKRGDRFFVSGSYRQSDAAQAQRDVFGASNVSGNQLNYSVSGGISHILNPTDTLTLIGSYNHSAFSGGGSTGGGTAGGTGTSQSGTPSTSVSGSAIWNRRVNRSLNVNVSSAASFTDYENVSATKTMSWRNTAGLTYLLTDDLTFSVNAGATVFDTRANSIRQSGVVRLPAFDLFGQLIGFADVPVSFDAPSQTGTTIGPIVDAVLNYRYDRSTDMSVSMSYGTSQNAFTDLSSTTSVSARLSHRIDHYSSISFAVGVSRQEAGGGSNNNTNLANNANSLTGNGDSLSASAAYSYQLTRELQAQLSYGYRLRHNTSGESVNNTVTLVISQDFTLKP